MIGLQIVQLGKESARPAEIPLRVHANATEFVHTVPYTREKKKTGKAKYAHPATPQFPVLTGFGGAAATWEIMPTYPYRTGDAVVIFLINFFPFFFLPFALASSRIAVLSGGIIFLVGELGVPSSFNALSPHASQSLCPISCHRTPLFVFFFSLSFLSSPSSLLHVFSHTCVQIERCRLVRRGWWLFLDPIHIYAHVRSVGCF